ncbi:peptide chain release factor N(5)-glutamine methyltransferase [Staphylococcus canis]|uniref:Release factor glutamine methyltransferase n=1 Tax=Staphylococcus canis TaxID=2724942 RepID=A0ABS0TCS1_9STAP|nr:peptide chain release factor N(5)-glutamine methyltransferase [Staphylococcus canis]
MNYKSWIEHAKSQVAQQAGDVQSVQWLVMDVLGWSRMDLILNESTTIPTHIEEKLNIGLNQLMNHVPVQYIVGHAAFYGRSFKVNENVLIPRPETEEVVAHFLKEVPTSGTVADIGTGSGVLAVTIKAEKPQLQVYASDISTKAIDVAKDNAKSHHTAIQFIVGEGLKPYIEAGIMLDGLISNPPYISDNERDVMDTSVIQYEPHIALFAENNGYAVYEQIFQDLPKVMRHGAPVVLEIGYQQGDDLKQLLFTYHPHITAHVHQDINKNERILSFTWFKQ